MAKLNYQKLAHETRLRKQAIVNTTTKTKIQPKPKSKVMPFGKYKGYHWQDIPTDYLNWMIKSFNDGELKQRAIQEVNRR